MADYYVNADSESDSGSGTTHGSPKKYLASALALLTFPITTETTIHLDPNTTADYTVAGNLLTFEHYTFSGSGSLTIQPYGWNDTYYNAGLDPLTGATALNPTAAKPCVLAFGVLLRETRCFELRGAELAPGSALVNGFHATQNCRAKATFCRANSGLIGFGARYGSELTVENSYAMDSLTGILSLDGSRVWVSGDNYVRNAVGFGVGAFYGSWIYVTPFAGDSSFARLDIRTTATALRRRYAGMMAKQNSTIIISGLDDELLYPGAALVRIIKEDYRNLSDYYGIQLESKSTLIGFSNVCYTDPNVNEGKCLIRSSKKLVAPRNEGVLVLA